MGTSKHPKEIYLQVESEDDFHEGITWCEDKINDTDVKYIRSDLVVAVME